MRGTIQIKVNGTLPGYAKGRVITVACDPTGIPLEEYWRRRLKDAETDNCCEVVVEKREDPPKSESPKGPRRSRRSEKQ